MAWRRLASILLLVAAAHAGAQDPAVPADRLLPMEARSKLFLITEGPEDGQEVVVSLSPSEAATGRWRLTMEKVGVVHLLRRDDGSVVIEQIDLIATNNRIIYDEPVRLLAPNVAPNERYTDRTTARVIDTKDGTVRQGKVVHEVDPVSRETFKLPAGDIEAFSVEADQSIELEQATVYLSLEGGLAEERGLVYGRVRYEIDKPLWFGSTTRHTLELASETATAEAAVRSPSG